MGPATITVTVSQMYEMTQSLPDLSKTTQPVAAESGFRCEQSGLAATGYLFQGVLCSDSEMGTVVGNRYRNGSPGSVASSSPLSSLVKPHQIHRGGAQGRGDTQAEITVHPGGVLAWVPSKANVVIWEMVPGMSQEARRHGKEKG